jgi:uncharacterized protein (DUF4415 family)
VGALPPAGPAGSWARTSIALNRGEAQQVSLLYDSTYPCRPPKSDRKQATTLRLDPDVIEYFRKDGPGWQTRISEVLRRAVKRSSR